MYVNLVAHLEFPTGVRSVLTPPEDLLPHRWVEKYRRLHEKDADESGGSASTRSRTSSSRPTRSAAPAAAAWAVFAPAG